MNPPTEPAPSHRVPTGDFLQQPLPVGCESGGLAPSPRTPIAIGREEFALGVRIPRRGSHFRSSDEESHPIRHLNGLNLATYRAFEMWFLKAERKWDQTAKALPSPATRLAAVSGHHIMKVNPPTPPLASHGVGLRGGYGS